MRAIVIDPYLRTVIETDIDGSAAAISDALGSSGLELVHEFETGDVLYIDEDAVERARAALTDGADISSAFAFNVGASQSFLGRGVILGPEDSRGSPSDARMAVSRLSSIVFIAPASLDDKPRASA